METNRANRIADLDATLAYYKALGQLAKRVPPDRRPPEVPPVSELRLIDGWLIRNGRPVWCAANGALVGNQMRAAPNDRALAEAAWLASLEQRISLMKEADRAATTSAVAGDVRTVNAIVEYYESLATQAQRAMQGDAPVPEVPDRSELELVGGWLMWKGQPVWWSGHRPQESAAVHVPAAPALEKAAAPARERPKLRRLLALPWRRAAA